MSWEDQNDATGGAAKGLASAVGIGETVPAPELYNNGAVKEDLPANRLNEAECQMNRHISVGSARSCQNIVINRAKTRGDMTMDTLMRRFTIICLTMAIFAFGLSALVAQANREPKRVHFGTATPCLHPATSSCVALL